MLRVSWTNKSVLDQLRNNERMTIVEAEKIAKFFGHVLRRNGLKSLTLERTVPGKISRGSSSTRYVELKTGLTSKNIQDSRG